MTSRHSVVSWLVFSDSDIQAARRLIDELDTSDSTVDTLGFGVALESLSEIFFPATTTLHRKIRYQIFIPALIWVLQKQKRIPDARFALKKVEYELQRALVASGETLGVIGRNRKEFLKYWPSLLYWNATNKLQVFGKEIFSMDEIFSILQRKNEVVINDDREIEAPASETNSKSITFDKEFEAIAEALFNKTTGKLLPDVTFELTPPEATYLKRKFQKLFPKSLTTYLLDRSKRTINRLDSPFELTSTRYPELNELVRQAELFSQFAKGATYAYRWVLCEHLRFNARSEAMKNKFSTYRDYAGAHFSRWRNDSPKVLKWDYACLTRAAADFEIDLTNPGLDKLRQAVLDAANFKGQVLQALQGLKKPIRDHEYQIKRNSSRFENQNISIPKNVFAAEYSSNTLFDYRWGSIGKSNAIDIVSKLEGAQ